MARASDFRCAARSSNRTAGAYDRNHAPRRGGPSTWRSSGRFSGRLHSMTRLAAVLVCLSVAGCISAAGPRTHEVEAGAEVTLAAGDTAALKATDTKVRFLSVSEDSRCPRDTTCIWAGEVKARFEIHAGENDVPSLEIPEGSTVTVGGHRVTLARVTPQPLSTKRIAPQDYRATVKI